MKIFLGIVLVFLASVYAEEWALTRLNRAQGVTFNLYTKHNLDKEQVLTVGDDRSLIESNFRNDRPTRFITHGFMGSYDLSYSWVVARAYAEAGDYNIIFVDWYAISGLLSKPLETVANGGAEIARCIDWMVQVGGLDLATTQGVGFSLGAHVMAYGARLTTGELGAVVGLDPAGDIFEKDADALPFSINSDDAKFVEIIHTSGGKMGLQRAAGDADFYVNGGSSQPECFMDLMGICAHVRANFVFAESIIDPHIYATEEDPNVYLGGGELQKSARGSYTVRTTK